MIPSSFDVPSSSLLIADEQYIITKLCFTGVGTTEAISGQYFRQTRAGAAAHSSPGHLLTSAPRAPVHYKRGLPSTSASSIFRVFYRQHASITCFGVSGSSQGSYHWYVSFLELSNFEVLCYIFSKILSLIKM